MIKSTLCYIEKDGKYLMMFRGKKPNDPNAGKWIGIGGKFEEGESPDECMLREVREETGLLLTEYHFHGIIRFRSDAWEYEDMYLYSAKAPTGAAGGPDKSNEDAAGGSDVKSEGAALKDCSEGELSWIDKEQIMELPLWEGDRLFLKKLLDGEETIEMTLQYEGETLVNKEEQ